MPQSDEAVINRINEFAGMETMPGVLRRGLLTPARGLPRPHEILNFIDQKTELATSGNFKSIQ